ncbi:MAG: WD40 repeat domain-containing protein [Aliarcobacter sp.]|nr:WD40 repeat domain-containing protein [Aliarcobacter sp.]
MRSIIFIFLTTFLTFSFLNAKDLTPFYSLDTSGGVTDLLINDEKLYVATTASAIDIFDINTKERIDKITVAKITDFTGDEIDSKVYSVDVLDKDILILSQGKNGGRNIDIYKNKKLERIILDEDRLFIARAKYLDDNHIIYALLSNQLYLYDIKNKRISKEIQISQSRFSNFSLSNDKSKIIVADESGNLTMLDSKTFDIIRTFKGQNLDNVFQVDIKNDLIITAGQDRRTVIYNINQNNSYYKDGSFLIYSVGLSPSAKLGAFSSDEENNVTVFDTNTKKDLYKLTQNKSTLTNILFLNENEIFVTSDDKKINYYKLN